MTPKRIACTYLLAVVLQAGPVRATENPALEALLAGSDGRIEMVFRKAGPCPTFVAGPLPSTEGMPADTAAEFLGIFGEVFGVGGRVALVVDHVIATGAGSVVRFHGEVDGVPIDLASVAVRTDAEGRVRAVAVEVPDVVGVDTEPGVPMSEAAVLGMEAADALGLAHLGEEEALLVILPVPGGGARLAWRIEPGAVPALFSNPIVYIDAMTGGVLLAENATRFDRMANVYLENPVTTPTIEQVQLTTLPVGSTSLTGPRTQARNCIDLHGTTRVVFMGIPVDIHTCSEVQHAAADGSGDFLYDADPTAPEDDFAETMMYYAVENAYDFYRSLGFDLLDEVPIPATVNFRAPINMYAPVDLSTIMAATDPYGPLYPFDNAMFVEAGSLFDILTRETDSMLFGQGTDGDFAFDGDVATHEFGHAVVAATCSLQWYQLDELGLDPGPGALNEGFADVGAFMSTLDPVVGDYAGSWLTGGGIRDVSPDRVCPEDLSGESHSDSLMMTSALWNIVEAMPGEEASLAAAFFAAEVGLSPTSDLAEASAAIIAAVEDSMGATAAASARTALEASNVDDCERVIALENGYTYTGPLLLVPGSGMGPALDPFLPGPLQFRITADRDYGWITLSFRVSPDPMSVLFGTDVSPVVVFGQGPDPVAFAYSGTDVTGDFIEARSIEERTPSYYEESFSIEGLGVPAGDYFLVLGNDAVSGYYAQQIRAVLVGTPPVPEPDAEPDAGEEDEVEAPPDAEIDEGGDGGRGTGCGC